MSGGLFVLRRRISCPNARCTARCGRGSVRFVAVNEPSGPPAQDHLLDILVGVWEGDGLGFYPTIESFGYRETLEIRRHPKGFLVHQQRTSHADDGRPLHAEIGYWRSPSPGRFELVLAHPTGVTEVCEGSAEGTSIHLRSTDVGCSGSARTVQSLERWYEIDGDTLTCRLSMGAVGVAHQAHLEATLRREA